MILMFGVMHRDQRGITLVEMLVAIGVAGIIAVAIVGAIFQLVTVNTRTSDHMIAVRQVQQAGAQLAKDTYQAQNVTLAEAGSQYPEGSGFPLTLTWTDLAGHHNVVLYSVNGRDELEREHSVSDGDDPVSHTIGVAARHIDILPENTNLSRRLSDDHKIVLVFRVTATVGHHSETRVYEVQPRPHQKEGLPG